MKKFILLLGFVLVFPICTPCIYLFSDSSIYNITTSNSFSQGISSLSPSVQVITAKDIELLGVQNISEVLNLIDGVLVHRVNGATSEVYMRGFIPELKLNPLILLDGMEIAENFYNRTYLNNIPVTIDDIDRIEIIKTSSSDSNGYIPPAGIINIVTKHAQFLNNDYVSGSIGSKKSNKYNFSLDGYNFSTYWKLTGLFRGVNDFNSNKRINKTKMVNLSVDKYVGNSKFFIKASISENDLDFLESYPIGINHKMYTLKMYEEANNLEVKNLLINYKRPHIDSSFYYQDLTGNMIIRMTDKIENSKFINEFYKFSFRYSINNLLTGFETKYYHAYIERLTSCYDYSIAPFFNYKFNIFKNFIFKFAIRNEIIRNSGSNFNYKFNLAYLSNDRSLEINAGYTKSIKSVPMYSKYTNYSALIPIKNIDFPSGVNIITYLHSNKNLRPIKIYITDFSVLKKWKNFIFKTTLFYNRFTDTLDTTGFFKYSIPPVINFYNINLMDFVIHGFESSINYKPNHNLKIFASYILQHIKNKTFKVNKNYYLPKYKITGGILFDYSEISGSITTNYIPTIKSYPGEKSDYIFSVNANIIKKLYNDKLAISIHAENIFNDIHKEAYYGENIDRLIYLKIKYNF